MTGTVYNRSTRKSRPNWAFSVYIGKDAQGKKQFLYRSGFERKQDAEEARGLAIAEWKAAKDRESSTPETLAAFLPHWFEQHAERNCTPATVERYRALAEFILPTLGPEKLTALTPLIIEREMNRLHDAGGRRRGSGEAKPLAPKTVRHIAGVLSVALNSAVRWGMLPSNPCRLVTLPRLEKKEEQALDHTQTDWLLECARSSWIYPLLVVAAATGARRGELLALTWPDIDLNSRLVSVSKSLEQTREGLRVKSTKNRKARVFSLPESAAQVLREHRAEQAGYKAAFGAGYRSDLDLVFCDPAGDYRKPDSVTATACRVAQKAGFPGLSLHNLRHGHGSQLLSAGVPLPAVSARLGHSSPHVTAQVYSHALKRDELEAAEKWEAAMRKAQEEQGRVLKN